VASLVGNVLITGGAGFLGRGIMRRAQRENWDVRFTVLSRDEKKQHECAERFPRTRYVLGDVTDAHRLATLMIGHDAIIHAAAIKYIPEGEFNADECVRVNIDGSRCVIDAAQAAGIEHVVGISTDKAAMPVNIYGMTKAVMERLFAEAGFNTCRYGNVIGSTGSVVPVMKRQLETKGMVSVTDPHMTRFWMSVDDAVDTIIAAFDATRGSTIIPSPRSATMSAIAHAVVLHPEHLGPCDHGIQVIGLRPGEKMHEDLVSSYETPRLRSYGDRMKLLPPGNEDYDHATDGISSHDAERLSFHQLVDMIADSESV